VFRVQLLPVHEPRDIDANAFALCLPEAYTRDTFEVTQPTMNVTSLSRRELLLKCAAVGSLTVVPSLSFDEALWAWQQSDEKPLKPTPWNEIGPFYKREAPHSAQLSRPGDPGMPVKISGKVFDTRGDVLSGAKIEIWQASPQGVYDLDGYDYRTTLLADPQGRYDFASKLPGHYPGRVCQHIHYLVNAPGHKQVIAAGADKVIAFIDASTGKTVRKLAKMQQPVSWSSLKVSPDGAHFATVCMTAENLDKPRPVEMWSMATGQRQSEWMPPSIIRAVGWTHDGQLVSVGGTADSLLIWRIQ